MGPPTAPIRVYRLALIVLATLSIVVLMMATPPPPEEVPPTGQIQVAPLAVPPEAPMDVLVPGDFGRVLSPFLVILEGDGSNDIDGLSVWIATPSGNSYRSGP